MKHFFVRVFKKNFFKNTVDRNGTSVCVKKIKSEVKFGIIAGGSFQNERGSFQNLEGPFRTRSNSGRVLSEFRALRVLSKPDLASPFRIWVGPFRISVLSKSDLASPFRIWVGPFRIWRVLSETIWVAIGGVPFRLLVLSELLVLSDCRFWPIGQVLSDCSSFQNDLGGTIQTA